MNLNDPLGDMLSRIRNASMRHKSSVRTPSSKIRKWVLDVLLAEGYIRGYEEVQSERGHPELEIALKYFDGASAIRELKRVSTPGRRVYSGYKTMPRVYNGFGTVIVSTSAGVITGKKAVANKVGGEIICTVW